MTYAYYKYNFMFFDKNKKEPNSRMNKRVCDSVSSTLEIKYDNLTSIEIFKNRIIYDNQLFEGYSFVKHLFYKAYNRIIRIDSYLEYSVL